jgi:hypothetical protein
MQRGKSTLQMFTGIYRDSAGVFCNICRENPLIFTDFPCNSPAICKYYRVFPADIAKKKRRVPVNPCKHLQCRICLKYFHQCSSKKSLVLLLAIVEYLL